MITLQEFWDELNRHDWYHKMSDDFRVDQRGSADWKRLEKIAEGKPKFQKMMEGFIAHYYSGHPFQKDKKAKPLRPE